MNSTQNTNPLLEYQIPKTSITFLDTEVYVKNNKLYTKICRRKKTDRQTYLNVNSKRPKPLKSSILYIQALIIKRICSKTTDF